METTSRLFGGLNGIVDLSEINDVWSSLITQKKNENFVERNYEFIDYFLFDYDINILKDVLNSLAPFPFQPYTLYRIVANKKENLILVIFHKDITSSAYHHIDLPDIDENVEKFNAPDTPSLCIDYSESMNINLFSIKTINSSVHTVINNIIETFIKHDDFPLFIDLWYIKSKNRKVKSITIGESYFSESLNKAEVVSLKEDFDRYLHQYIKPMSVFDIVGPSMVGPSSSHTAGANRIGKIARNIIIAKHEKQKQKIKSIEVRLLGSFRDTGPGHKTPLAIGGGLSGYDADHPEMLSYGEPDYLLKNGIAFEKETADFLGYVRGSINDEQKYRKEHNNNIAEINVVTDQETYTITGFSIGGGNVEIRYINSRLTIPVNGKTDFYIINNQVVTDGVGKQSTESVLVQKIDKKTTHRNKRYKLPFNSFEELEEFVEKNNKDLIRLILEVEYQFQNTNEDDIYNQIAEYWKIMQRAVELGIHDSSLSTFGLTGKDSGMMVSFLNEHPVFDNLHSRAAAYAVAVNETNAKSGVVVACPTAGSCGILPGVLKAYTDFHPDIDPHKVYEAILVAGFFGMIMFNDVSTAGADYGCQAEIGVGAAMAASALCFLEGGNISQLIHAFILAIKNSLGLICDPVAGLVEVPCVKRNGIYASASVTAAIMALSNVRSFISPDEVVLTMKEVGNKLHRDYKETAAGGLALTRDGKAIDKAFESVVNQFFCKNVNR